MTTIGKDPGKIGQSSPLHKRIWRSRQLYLYIAPTLLLLLTFSYYPAISALVHAFYEWTPWEQQPEFVGLQNFVQVYADLFSPLPATAGATWARLQWAVWAAPALLAACWFFFEAVRNRRARWPMPLGWLAGLGALAILGVSAATGLDAGLDGALRGHFVAGHGLLALAGAILLVGSLKMRPVPDDPWTRRMGLATLLVPVLAIGLLVRMSQGGELRLAFGHLLVVMSFSLTIGLAMPLLIAEVLFHLPGARSTYVYRVLFVIPMVVPGIVHTLMWGFIYDKQWGVLNQLLLLLQSPGAQVALGSFLLVLIAWLLMLKYFGRVRRGLAAGVLPILAGVLAALPLILAGVWGVYRLGGGQDGYAAFVSAWTGLGAAWSHLPLEPQGWLSDPDIALYAIMMMGFPWVGTVSMLIFYAGLQSIPDSVLEAARLDGCTGLRRFARIDFPMILGQFKLLLILGIIGGIQGFQNVLILTYGGPGKATEMPGLIMFKEAFRDGRLGYGTTIGVVMFLIILVVTFVNMRYIRPATEES